MLAAVCPWLADAADAQLRPVKKASLQLALDRDSYAPGDTLRVVAVVEIEDNWHIQSHRPSLEYLIATEVRFTLPEGWPSPQVEYPPHVMWQAGFESEPLAVYKGRTTIVATLRVPEAASARDAAIEGSLYYQACNDLVCLRPTTAEALVSTVIGESGAAVNQELFEPQLSSR